MERQDDIWKTIAVQYRLSSGKKVNRTYTIRMNEEAEECWTQIYDSVEFKMGKYPVLSQSSQDTEEIYFQQYNQVQKVEIDHQMQEHLLEVYQSELKSLTIETRKKEYPMATIQFRTKNQCEGISRIESLRGLSDSWYSAEYISNRCYYPVYPSFTKTIRLLGQYGVSVKDEALSDKIVSVTVSGYAPNSDSYQTVTFTDPEEIKALGDITRNERMLYYDLMYEEDDLTVEVTVSGKTGKAEQEDDMENTYSSFFKKGEVPQIVKDRMGF